MNRDFHLPSATVFEKLGTLQRGVNHSHMYDDTQDELNPMSSVPEEAEEAADTEEETEEDTDDAM